MQEDLTNIELKLAELEGKVDALYQSSEKTRKYLLWTFWVTAAVIILPLLVLPLLLPAFMASLGVGAGF